MNKLMDKAVKYSAWIVLSLMLLAYFAFQVLDLEGDIVKQIEDWRTWLHVVFVVSMQTVMVSASYDWATSAGVESTEFIAADKDNNELIVDYNNNKTLFRSYIKQLNEYERKTMQEDFLHNLGDKKVEELTKKELRAYKRLKPISHNVTGFNLPLIMRNRRNNGNVDYNASINLDAGKMRRQFQKGLFGVVFAAMSVNVMFQIKNFGSALTSLIIIAAQLLITLIMVYVPQYFKLTKTVPNLVQRKKELYKGFEKVKHTTSFEVEKEEVKDTIISDENTLNVTDVTDI